MGNLFRNWSIYLLLIFVLVVFLTGCSVKTIGNIDPKVLKKFESCNSLKDAEVFDKEGNKVLMPTISLEKQKCFQDVISNLPKDFDCAPIRDNTIKGHCYLRFAVQNNDKKSCDNAGGDFKSACYLQLAKNNNDVSLCDKVKWNYKTECISQVDTKIAVETNDSSVCNRLPSDFRCLSTMGVILRNLSLCDGIDPGLTEKDYPLAGARIPKYVCKEFVIKQIAIDANDVNICNTFKFEGGKYMDSWVPKARCIEEVAFCNMNENACESLRGLSKEYDESEINACKSRAIATIPNVPLREGQKQISINHTCSALPLI